MKKATELKNWLEKKISKLFPSERPNIIQNQQEIMNLLFYSNFNELSTSESITVFENIKAKFEAKMSERKELYKSELTEIMNFDGSNVNQRYNDLKELTKRQVFDLPVKDFKEVEFKKAE